MATIHHQVAIDAPAAKVYEAIATPNGIGTWWDKQTATHTDRGLVPWRPRSHCRRSARHSTSDEAPRGRGHAGR